MNGSRSQTQRQTMLHELRVPQRHETTLRL
jgi:hypothetical protein